MDRPAEMTDREPKAAPGDFSDEVVEAEIAGPEDNPAPFVQGRSDLFGTQDVDLRLPAVGPPGAQILEAFLVAIGPVFGRKATSIWRVGEDRSYVRSLLAVPLRMRRRVDPAEQA